MSLPRQTHKTTCSYCGVGCGVLVHRNRDGALSLEGDPDHPVNRGKLCSKGQNLLVAALDRSDRLTVPELRPDRDSPRQEVTWEAAMARAAQEFHRARDLYGPDSVAFYVSGQCLTEEYYLANKLVKGFLGTNNIDTNSRLCMSSAVTGYKMALGEDAVPGCYEDLDLADLYLVAGANPAACHPILFRRMEARLGEGRAKMIVVDPRRTPSAALADLHLAIIPGTDVALFNAWARILMEEGAVDRDFIRFHTEGGADLQAAAFSLEVAQVSTICGVPESQIRLGAAMISQAQKFLSLWAMGLNQSTAGVEKNLGLLNLHLITGQIGKPGCGPFSLTGQPNAMGGREVGGMATLLSAHRNLSDPRHRQEVASYWGVPRVPEKPGLTAGEMVEALIQGKLKVLWIICTNPLVSWPDLDQAEKALSAADFVIVQDISRSADTLAFADLVLPAAGWLEKEGTMTNSERRITHLSPVLAPPGQALPDGEILIRFAGEMGWGSHFAYTGPGEVFREHAGLTAGTRIDISGLDYERLKDQGSLQWPVPDPHHPGTSRLFTDGKFYRPGGKALLHGVEYRLPSVTPTPSYPLILTTGRIRDQWHTMTRTGKVRKLMAQEPESRLDIHPEDALTRGIREGDVVTVSSPQGQVTIKARFSRDLRQGVVFLPLHWGRVLGSPDVRANNLTALRWDPTSKQPDLKFTPVQVTRREVAGRTVVVVGAGAGAAAFLKTYRAFQPQDRLVVFSGEPHPFYDRIRLPEYLEDPRSWEKMTTVSGEEARDLDLEVHPGCRVVKICRENKTVLDDRGRTTGYDILVLATGSRAVRPPQAPDLQGIHTLRSRWDADGILASAGQDKEVVVVGGGLLGLETAASFLALGRKVHLVHRSDRIMDKQLDETAGQLLVEELRDRGLQFHFFEEVSGWDGGPCLESVTLKSGLTIGPVVLIYALGTLPNAELGAECGLEVQRGIVVNSRLETSDPSIIALGEVAEWEGQLFGFTAGAEDQAQIAAAALAGDVQAVYRGSLAQNLLKVPGISLVSLGEVKAKDGEAGAEVVMLLDRGTRYYKKLVIRNSRLVGCLMVGDKSDLGEYRKLIATGMELGERRKTLLRSGSVAVRPRGGRTFCSCMEVDEAWLEDSWSKGQMCFADLQNATGAGTGCGSCRPELKAWIDSKEGVLT